MLPSHIKAIVFDAYGTLFNIQALDQPLAMHFGDQAGAVNEIWRRKQLEYTWLRGLMNAYVPFSKVTLQALQFACEQLGLPLTEKARVDLLQAYYQLSAFEDVPKEMVRLSQSYQLAVLSNADENMLQAALKNSDLASLFTKVLSVNALQRYKPDPWVYNLAVSQLGLQPPEIAFVSSNTWDVSGARAYGLFVCWLQRGGKVMDQLGQQPDMLIKNLSELG